MPRGRELLRAVWRGMTLRCPRCGSGGILQGWFGIKERCPRCGLRLERGEEEDYFSGGMMLNIILAVLIFGAAFVIALVVMWPNVPWDALEYWLVGAMIVLPILLYPMSRTLWLALDLAFRPRSERD